MVGRGKVLALITAAVAVDVLVYSMIIPLLPAYGEVFGLDQFQLGLLLATYAAGLFVATPASGLICDRYGYARPLLAGLAGLVLAILLFAVAASYSGLLLARFLQGAASGATWTAGLALIAERYPPERRGGAMGIALAGNSLGLLVGPPFGGLAAEALGLRLPFVLAAAVAAVLLPVALAMRASLRGAGTQTPRTKLGLLWRGEIRALALALLALTAVFTLIEPTLPLHFVDVFDAGAGTIGLLFGAIMLGHGLCTAPAGWASDRYGAASTIRVGGIILAISLPALVMPTSLPMQAAALFVYGMATAFALVPTLPLMAALVDKYRGGGHALAFALFNMVYAAGMMLGPSLGSAMAQWLGLLITLSLSGLVVLLLLWRLPGS